MSRLRNRRLALSALAGITQRAVQLAAALITLPLVLHSLGLAGFGIWGAASSLAWAVSFLDFGLGAALVTLIPRALAIGKSGAPYVAASLYGGVILALLLLLAAGVAWGAGTATVFLLASAALALNVPLGIATNLWFAVQKGHIAAVWELAQTLVTLALLIFAAWCHATVLAMVGAVYGGLLLCHGASLAAFLIAHPTLRPGAVNRAVLRETLGGGLSFFGLTIAVALGYIFDTVLALQWLGPDASARMTVVMRLCMTATGFLAVATEALWPAFAEAAHSDDVHWVRRTLWRGTAAVLAMATAGSLVLFSAGPVLLHLWLGGGVLFSLLLWGVIAFWIIIPAIPRVISLYLNAAGQVHRQTLVVLLANGLAFGLKYALAARFGTAGILAAMPLVWLVLVCPLYLWWGWRQGGRAK
jgi:O-antigen/teichoic acid export membrane protein